MLLLKSETKACPSSTIIGTSVKEGKKQQAIANCIGACMMFVAG
jgi:hypothetical protein